VGGRYRLGKSLGEGGAAQVFEAWDETLERRVAVKLLFPVGTGEKADLIARFLREAKISAAVQHQHVISIVDFGTTDDATPYMVMELLRGLSLARRLETDVVISPMEVIELGALILRGLGAVHRAAIVHSDLKPENIFLVQDGDGHLPKILDFGISLSIDPSGARTSVYDREAGMLVGTPEYMSPEQVRGRTDVDTRTDIYSVGVILYEAVAGRLPFEAEELTELLNLIAVGGVPPAHSVAPWVPEPLSQVIARAMCPSRDGRYQTTDEMFEALVEIGEDGDLGKGGDVTSRFRVVRSVIPPDPRDQAEITALAKSVTRYHMESRSVAADARAAGVAKRHRMLAVLVGAGMVLLALVAVLTLNTGDEASETRPLSAAVALEVPTITDDVRLENVPPGGTIRLDGVVTSHHLVIVRDQGPHVIEVSHPDRQRWRVTHVATGSAVYVVEALPREASADGAAGPTPTELEARRRAARRERRRGMLGPNDGQDMSEPESPAMGDEETGPPNFRMLDY